MNQHTLYFLYDEQTKRAVTKAVRYSEISEQMKDIRNKDFKLGELVFNIYQNKTISILPSNAIPMEKKFRLNGNEAEKPEEKRVIVFTVREPIWAKPRSVALNYQEIFNSDCELIGVDIVYRQRTKNDERLYPDPMYMEREKALKYPVNKIRDMLITTIPIDDFRIKA